MYVFGKRHKNLRVIMKRFFGLAFVMLLVVTVVDCSGSDSVDEEVAVEDPNDQNDNDDSNNTGPNPDFPLSDQMNTGNWALNTEISDEFEAPLDETKWLIQGRNGEFQSNFRGRPPSQFSVNNAIVEDGKLKIVTKWEPDYNFNPKTNSNTGEEFKDITTAAVISKKQFKYGYMEIKSKSANAPITSSFWTTGKNTSELDMFETFGGHKTNTSWRKRLKFNMISWDPNNTYYQPNGNGPVFTQNIQVDNNTADDFHVYGFDWTPEYIKVYYDGVLLPEYTVLKSELTNNGANPERWVTDSNYWVWFDSETFPWLGLPTEADLPAEYEIEYLRVWQKQ